MRYGLWISIACVFLQASADAQQVNLFPPTGRYAVQPVVVQPIVETVQDTLGEYVVVFTTTNCPPCKRVKEVTIPELRRRKIHVREISDSSIAAQFGVTRFPVVMLARSERELKRWSGFISAETICQSLTNSVPEQAIAVTPDSGQNVVMLETTDRPGRFSFSTKSAQGVQMPVRYIEWPGWGTIDLETYSRSCNCGMCQSIRLQQQEYQRQLREYQQSQTSLPSDQQPCPIETIETMLDLMRLRPDDVLADLGCGDGRILIAAARRGIRGIGVELDYARAEVARDAVKSAGLSHLIRVEQGDARQFDQSRVTAITAYLYPTLLAELSPKLRAVRVVGSPFHEVPGLRMTQHGDVWIYNRDHAATVAAGS